jgi:PAS domain S-box-containing protein
MGRNSKARPRSRSTSDRTERPGLPTGAMPQRAGRPRGEQDRGSFLPPGAFLQTIARDMVTGVGMPKAGGRRGTVLKKAPPLEGDRFHLLVDAVAEYAIYMLDPEGRVVSWNRGAERLKGYRSDEITGQHFSLFYTEEDRAAGLPLRALETAEREGRFESEGWRVRKDGGRFWANAIVQAIRAEDGRLLGFAKVTRDMTERRAAEETLRASERSFRLLMQSVVDYALFMLDTEGYVVSWNPGAQRAKGYRPDEIIGRHFSLFYTEEDRATGLPQRALETAATTGRFEAEGWRVRKDGTRFWANVVIDAIHDEEGKLVGFAKITRDITERRALEQAREQLHQARKMEMVGQLTGGLAHDFNNLLTAVLGSLSLIAGGTNDPRTLRFADTAQRAATRGAQLTQQLLAFARRQRLQPQAADINDLIRSFEPVLRNAGGATVAMLFDFVPDAWLVEVDPSQFQSALLNLVVNARDAMPGGGRIEIATRNVELSGRGLNVPDLPPGSFLCISVRDTGQGMNEEVRSRAVEPFFTTKEVGAGSGLGLSQVYGFARQSGGSMQIESAEGLGTTIHLFLPRSMAAQPADEPEEFRADIQAAGGGTVLVVEDDAEVLEIAIESLRELGYRVISASSAPAALELLQRHPDIRVLFSDIVMPRGMNGVDLAVAALRLRPGLKVLLASGYAREALGGTTHAFQEFDFIAKPYTQHELGVRLAKLLAR